MNLKEAIEAFECLHALSKMRLRTGLKLDIGHNKNVLRPVYELFSDERKDNSGIEGYEEYHKELVDITRAHSDERGVVSGKENVMVFEQKVRDLEERCAETVKQVRDKNRELAEALTKDVPVSGKFVMINPKSLPEEIDVDLSPIIAMIDMAMIER